LPLQLLAAELPLLFPPLWFFMRLARAEHMLLAAFLPFSRHGGCHRLMLNTGTAELRLTVPVHHGRQSLAAACIDYHENWPQKWRGILHNAYHQAPYFEELAPQLWSIIEGRYEFLGDLNTEIIRFAMAVLGLNKNLHYLARPAIAGIGHLLCQQARQYGLTYFLIDNYNAPFIDCRELRQAGLPCYEQDDYRRYLPAEMAASLEVSILPLLFAHGPELRALFDANRY
jgi:hypothetical protein